MKIAEAACSAGGKVNVEVSRYNRLCNPFYPYFSFYPEFLEGDLQALAEREEELLLFTAHVAVSNTDCLLLVSNKRLVLYRLRTNSLLRRVTRFAARGVVDAVMSNIPGYYEVTDVASAVRQGWTGKDAEQVMSEAERKFLTENVERSAKDLLSNKRGFGRSIGKQLFSVPLGELLDDIEAVTVQDGQANIVVRSGSAFGFLNETTLFFHSGYAGAILWSIVSRQVDYLAHHGFFLAPRLTDLGVYRSRNEEVESASETLAAMRAVDFFGLEEVDPGVARRSTDDWNVKNASGEPLGMPDLDGLSQLMASGRQHVILGENVPGANAVECNVHFFGLCEKLLEQEWCEAIKAAYIVPGGDEILAQTLLEIVPPDETTARYVWCFSGAVPSTCINAMRIPNRVEALVLAFDLFESWLAAPDLLVDPPFLPNARDHSGKFRSALREDIALIRRVKIARAVAMEEALSRQRTG